MADAAGDMETESDSEHEVDATGTQPAAICNDIFEVCLNTAVTKGLSDQECGALQVYHQRIFILENVYLLC